MRGIFQFQKKYPGKITVLLAFSFFVLGCHTGNDPVAQVTAKKEKADRIAEAVLPGITEAPKKTIAENDMEKEQNRHNPFPGREKMNNYTMTEWERDPFAFPAEIQKQKTIPAVNNKTPPAHTIAPYKPDPCVAGIFDNGKEKFALVRWQQVQGVFRCGERLGNGYYVKEITANSVFLCPEENRPGTDTVTLTLN